LAAAMGRAEGGVFVSAYLATTMYGRVALPLSSREAVTLSIFFSVRSDGPK
jgi:hypothetical protein